MYGIGNEIRRYEAWEYDGQASIFSIGFIVFPYNACAMCCWVLLPSLFLSRFFGLLPHGGFPHDRRDE